jgi:hypothetical protein
LFIQRLYDSIECNLKSKNRNIAVTTDDTITYS